MEQTYALSWKIDNKHIFFILIFISFFHNSDKTIYLPVVEINWDTISEDSSLNYHKIEISIPSKIEDIKHNVENILKHQSAISQLSKKRISFLKEQYGIPIDRNGMINIVKKSI